MPRAASKPTLLEAPMRPKNDKAARNCAALFPHRPAKIQQHFFLLLLRKRAPAQPAASLTEVPPFIMVVP
jgi:hypothetical protein